MKGSWLNMEQSGFLSADGTKCRSVNCKQFYSTEPAKSIYLYIFFHQEAKNVEI